MARALATATATLLLAIAFAGCLASPTGQTQLLDDSGNLVDVADPSRIIATSVDLVEIIIELGGADRLVAVPSWIESSSGCIEVPTGVGGLPRLGKPHVITAEDVVALSPTLVLVKDHPLQPTSLAPQLRRAGVAAFEVRNDETLDNVRHTYRLVGALLSTVDADAPAKAEDAIARFDSNLDNATSPLASSDAPTLRALYQFPAGLVAGSATTGGLLLELAGASNVAAAAGLVGYRQFSTEALQASDPERVVASCTAGGSAHAVYSAPKYQGTTASRTQPESLLVVDPSLTALVGPRFPRGLLQVAQWLDPAAFGLITPSVVVDVAPNGNGHATLSVDARNSTGVTGPLTLRVDPGDGSDAFAASGLQGAYEYDASGTYQARILLVDPDGRIYEQRQPVEVLG